MYLYKLNMRQRTQSEPPKAATKGKKGEEKENKVQEENKEPEEEPFIPNFFEILKKSSKPRVRVQLKSKFSQV